MNFGGALDGDRGSAGWLRERHFDVVRDAGSDTVRLPVNWSAHAEASAAYRIDGGFFECVDRAVDAALRRGLGVVLDVHHFDELSADHGRPGGSVPRDAAR